MLDIGRGEYALLEPVAAAFWEALTDERTDAAALTRLSQRFDSSAERLSADFAAFRAQCLARGWLTPRPHRPAPVRPAVASPVVTACALIAATRRRLNRGGFAAAYEWAVERAPAAPEAADPGRLARAERAFRLAETILPNSAAPDDCLPRSLALFAFLRRMRLPARHRIGVQRMPFGAHAWVECGDRVILDTDRRSELLALCPAIPRLRD